MSRKGRTRHLKTAPISAWEHATRHVERLIRRFCERDKECRCAGLLQRAPPFAPQPLSGGALADEMGLGKTVVALALILKRPPPSAWYAPAAPVTGGPQASPAPVTDPAQGPPSTPAASAGHPRGGQGARAAGATLIVATPALLGQWDNEVS